MPSSPRRAWLSQTDWRLLRLFRPQLSSLILASLCMILVSATLGAQVLLLRRLLDALITPGDARGFLIWPLALASSIGFQAAGEIGRGYFARRAGLTVMLELRTALFAHYQTLSLPTLQAQGSAELMSRLMNDVELAQRAVTAFITLLQKPLSLLVLWTAASTQEPTLTLLSLVFFPLLLVPLQQLRIHLRQHTRAQLDSLSRLNTLLQESLQGARVIRAYSGERRATTRFSDEARRQVALQLKVTVLNLLAGPLVQLTAVAGVGFMLWFGGQKVASGALSPGALLTFLASLALMHDPLKSLVQVPLLLSQTRAGLDRIFDLLDTPGEEEDADALELPPGPPLLALENVSFRYADTWVLRQVSLQARPGEIIGLVGLSGAGKSTLLNLIPRLLDPSEGRLTLGGVDIRRLKRAALRSQLALVTQETFLFDASVAENLRWGRPEASLEALQNAIRMAQAEAFVRGLPEGLDTRLGEQAQRLSGGERQRLSLARALVRQAPILLLDEATAALDQASEEGVFQALETGAADRITLVVAHRLSSLRRATRLVVLEGGRVVEEGTHDALLARGGRYAQLYSLQHGTSSTDSSN